MTKLESVSALLAQTAAAEEALLAQEYERYAAMLEDRGAAMAALDAQGTLSEGLTAEEVRTLADQLRALQAADERMMALVAERLGETRGEIGQQQLATLTLNAYRQANRRVAPQFAARFVDQQK